MKREKELLEELRRGPVWLQRKQATAIVAYVFAVAFSWVSIFIFLPLLPRQYVTVNAIVAWVIFTQGIVFALAFTRASLDVRGPKALGGGRRGSLTSSHNCGCCGRNIPNCTCSLRCPKRWRMTERVPRTGGASGLGFALSYAATKLGWLR